MDDDNNNNYEADDDDDVDDEHECDIDVIINLKNMNEMKTYLC